MKKFDAFNNLLVCHFNNKITIRRNDKIRNLSEDFPGKILVEESYYIKKASITLALLVLFDRFIEHVVIQYR